MIEDPINDHTCLGQLVEHAKRTAGSPVARRIAATVRTMENAVLVIRAKPQGKNHRCGAGPILSCDTPQSARFWAPDPDCVERTLDFGVMAELI